MSEAAEKIQEYYGSNYSNFYSQFFSKYHKLSNGGWSVLCPFHEDNKPSLSIDIKTGLFHCHACGEKGNAIQFWMKKHGCDFVAAAKAMCEQIGAEFPESKKYEQGGKREKLQGQAQKTNPVIVAEYNYTDSTGRMIFQAIRLNPKSFRQRQPMNGGWQWNLKGITPVLYNLPEVLKSQEVLIVEGEKDVETARQLGFTATTCAMGAGKWREYYNSDLAGKDVILVPDNDKPGMEHMLSIGKALQSVCRSVRWFQYPDEYAKHHGFDFSDLCGTYPSTFVSVREIDSLIMRSRTFDAQKIVIPEPDTPFSDKIKEWIFAAPGEFTTKDLDYDLGIKDVVDKTARTKALEKFVAEKLLSREGTRRGTYRPYRSELEIMDYQNIENKFMPVFLPFGLHNLVGLLPGNIVVVAGEPNAGKTGLLLNIIKNNMGKFNIHYFNSEMGGAELKTRLMKFDDVPFDAWKFNAYHRDDNFADVIFQGEQNINVIDFLEVHDNFYLIGEKIKQIHAALNGALAIIAIQRNKGSEFALGGQRTMEKARLVINISPGEMRLTKAKNFVKPDVNPNGMKLNFKLADGCKFITQGSGWYKEQA